MRFIVALLAALFAVCVGSVSVYAQTPTPTPTPHPNYGDWSDVFAGGYNPDALYLCSSEGTSASWSNNPVFPKVLCNQSNMQWVDDGAGGYTVVSDPIAIGGLAGDGTGVGRAAGALWIVPPEAVMTVTMGCDVTMAKSGSSNADVQANLNKDALVFTVGSEPSLVASTSFMYTFYRETVSDELYLSWSSQAEELAADAEGDQSVPGSTVPQFSYQAIAAFSSLFAEVYMACVVTGLEVDPNWGDATYNPYPEYPGGDGGDGWGAIGYDPISWDKTQAITQTIEFGIGEVGVSECYDIPPEIGPYTVTIPGWGDWVAHVPGVELCVASQDIGFEVFDIDLGALLFSLFGVSLAAFFIRTIFT